MGQYESNKAKANIAKNALWRKFAIRPLLATLLLAVVVPAYGSIINFSGDVQEGSLPQNLTPGNFESNTTIWAFTEQQNVTIGANEVGVGISMPGTWVCCSSSNLSPALLPAGDYDSYLLYASPASAGPGGYVLYTGSITFSPGQKTVGIIIGNSGLLASNSLFGVPDTMYPPSTYSQAGLDPADFVIWGSGSNAVYVNLYMGGPGNVDMVRIITTVTPEPAAFLLLGSGLLALALVGRRKRASRLLRPGDLPTLYAESEMAARPST